MNTFEIQESWETAGGAEQTQNGGEKIWMEKREGEVEGLKRSKLRDEN